MKIMKRLQLSKGNRETGLQYIFMEIDKQIDKCSLGGLEVERRLYIQLKMGRDSRWHFGTFIKYLYKTAFRSSI